MPTYEYRCEHCDENFDVVQSFQDDPLQPARPADRQCARSSATWASCSREAASTRRTAASGARQEGRGPAPEAATAPRTGGPDGGGKAAFVGRRERSRNKHQQRLRRRLPAPPAPDRRSSGRRSRRPLQRPTKGLKPAGQVLRHAPVGRSTRSLDPTRSVVRSSLCARRGHRRMAIVDQADLDRLLVMLAELDGSDLHIKAGAPPRMRIAGALRTLEDEPAFTAEETQRSPTRS